MGMINGNLHITGAHNGWVFAQTAGKTCKQVCENTFAKTCVNGVRVQGSYGAQKKTTDTVGHYYTLGCEWPNPAPYAENTRSTGPKSSGVFINNHVVHAHYCCCSQLRKNWVIEDKVMKTEIVQ